MSWISRLVNVWRHDRLTQDLDDEIEFHLRARSEEFRQAGMAPAEAGAQARRQFGNPLFVRDSSRDIKLPARLDSIFQDVRFGLRLFRKNAALTAAAVLSLSLAIGACTAAFSLIDALILRLLPVKEPQDLVYALYVAPADSEDREFFNYPLFERMRRERRDQIQLFGMSFQSQR